MADLILNWGLFGSYGTEFGTTQSVDTGGVEVSVGFTAEDEDAQAFTYNAEAYVATGEDFNPYSGLKLFGAGGEGGVDDTSTTTLSFASTNPLYSDEVSDVSFRINDIDMNGDDDPHFDMLTIEAFDADGNPVDVTITGGSDVNVAGGSVTGGTSPWEFTDGQGSALITIAGPVASITIGYDNGDEGDQRVLVSDVHFSTLDSDDDNDAPDAVLDMSSTDEDTAVIIDVLGNDTDPDGDTLTVTGTTDPANGSVIVNADGTVTYTPDTGFVGTDTFDYTITDPSGATDTATVSVVVTDPATVRDGIVYGTGGDDLIDTAYTGDPDGDFVDANDEILPGEGPNDDIIIAGGGDDTVYAGEGDDDVTGGDGDDVIYGETGDDEITGGDGSDTVDGGEGNDIIDTSGSDPLIDATVFPGVPVDGDIEDDRDSVSGGDGNDTITTGDDRDTIDGGAGDDVIYSGIDNDSVSGGDGDDLIDDVQGADTIHGGAGDDTILAGIDTFSDYIGDDPNLPIGTIDTDPNTVDGMDVIYGGDGNDSIQTGDDADFIDGGADNDTIDAGIDDDTIHGGTGDDSIIGGHGSDSILGQDGDDYIDASSSTILYADEPDEFDPVPENDRDYVNGGMGNDTILGGDDDDTIYGGQGNDVIDGGIDEDSIYAGVGDDTITGGHGSDWVDGGSGNDLITGNDPLDDFAEELDATDATPDNDRDYLNGREGDDTIYGGDDDDTLLGGQGNDYLDGGIDEDSIDGGVGDDTIVGGQGADTIFGGGGQDQIIGGSVGDVVDGGSGPGGIRADGTPNDYDTLDLTGSAPVGGSLSVTYTSADREDGTVEFFDAGGMSTGTMSFVEIENVVPCFTPGTAIATPKGERLVEDLRVGDRIITRDNGIQEIRWLGTKALTGHQLARAPHLRPILVQKGSLGNDLPEHDILLSPNHRLLINNEKTSLYFEEREVLAAAKHLTGLDGVDEVGTLGVTYVHFMFDRHEVVLSNGAWTESFQPGEQVLDGLGNAQRSEILELFPELETTQGINDYQAARRSLKKHEAKLLVR